jgi:hypothetical protein
MPLHFDPRGAAGTGPARHVDVDRLHREGAERRPNLRELVFLDVRVGGVDEVPPALGEA